MAVETFLDDIWATTHHHVQRDCAGYFDCLLSAHSAVKDLLERFRRDPSAVRLMRGKDKKSAESYRLAEGSLDLGRIRDDFADGYTIVLDGVDRHVRAIASLSRSIETELNFPTQVNAYMTPPGAQGLVPHYDDHDVLVLQIGGSKIWHLYPGADIPPHQLRRDDKSVAIEGLPVPVDLRLEAGDLLYMPRGRVHAAETESEPSVHLTVGIHAPTTLMLAVAALNSMSFHDDRLNAPLPPRHLDDADVDSDLGVLLLDAVSAVEDPGAVARGLEALADVLLRRGQCPPVGPAASAAEIDGQTLVTKYRPLYARVKADAGGVALRFASLSINAGPDHEAAMLFVSRSTAPFHVRDLPGLREEQQVELARSLVVSGFLIRLPND
ncbi:cupin domain-containing protein [Mycobacterium parmense]|uniref:cupin domain-containing protein n=1 Tax=Mycobacterium parmense TaxID=185642 RepID=UPI001E3F6969|nr:cupin domain-containing protein [Mycobacterium parmense]